MPRQIIASFRNDLQAQNAVDMEVIFATLTHPDLEAEIRVARDSVDYFWEGNTYTRGMFDIELISDDERPPRGRISVPNVDRRIGEAVLNILTPIDMRLDIFAVSDFDVLTSGTRTSSSSPDPDPLLSFTNLQLLNVACTSVALEAEITSWDLSNEPFPGVRVTKDKFPGLFR